MEKKCCFCERILNAGSNHIYACAKKHQKSLNKKEVKFLYISYNFPEISNKDILTNLYLNEQKSLPDIQKINNIDFKSILFLLDYYDISKRSMNEANYIGAQKTKKTLKENYGVTNVGQIESIKEKRKQTCIKKFGVNNIYKYPPFYDYVKKVVEKRYGCSLSELQSKTSKRSWANKTQEERINWLNKSILSNNVRFETGISNLERSFQPILNDLNITYTVQFRINKSNEKCYFYDYYINDYNLLIEINGDYWHCNPLFYKENDLVKFSDGYKKAGDVWKRDLDKKILAEKNDYSLIYIWEIETIDADLTVLLTDKLKEYENNKNKIN